MGRRLGSAGASSVVGLVFCLLVVGFFIFGVVGVIVVVGALIVVRLFRVVLARFLVGVTDRIGDEEDVGLGIAFIRGHQHLAGGGGVLDFLAVDRGRVVRDDRFGLVLLFVGVFLVGLVAGFIALFIVIFRVALSRVFGLIVGGVRDGGEAEGERQRRRASRAA